MQKVSSVLLSCWKEKLQLHSCLAGRVWMSMGNVAPTLKLRKTEEWFCLFFSPSPAQPCIRPGKLRWRQALFVFSCYLSFFPKKYLFFIIVPAPTPEKMLRMKFGYVLLKLPSSQSSSCHVKGRRGAVILSKAKTIPSMQSWCLLSIASWNVWHPNLS